jgi:type II secretory pathway pseudopilin PulG
MGVSQTQLGGFSLVEVVIAFGIAATAAATAFTVIASLDVIAARTQAESVVAQQLHRAAERYLGMPYSQLQQELLTTPTSSVSGDFRDYPTPPTVRDWSMTASLETVSGQTQIFLEITWAEPKLKFPRSSTQNRTIRTTLVRPNGV